MRLTVAFVACLLLAGCASKPDPAAAADAADAEAEAMPNEWTFAGCATYAAVLDAPASAYPADAPGPAVPGTLPGHVQARAFGLVCLEGGARGAELWVGFAVGGRDQLWLAQAWSSNGTRAEYLADLGAPVQNASMSLFYNSRTPYFYAEGPGTADAQHVLKVTAAVAQGTPAPLDMAFTWGDSGATLRWTHDATAWWSGAADYGTSAFVHPSQWNGLASRHDGGQARLTVESAAKSPA